MKSREYRLAAIMFTDIVGFSRKMEQDEQGTLALLSEHNAIIYEIASQFKGTVIKTIGDAFLIDFPNTVQAVQAAVSILSRFLAWNTARGGEPMELRIGIHLGDIHFFDDDALGEGINIASRLQQVAKPGKIAISQDVYNLIANKVKVPIEHRGEVKLKNIARSIEVYEISVTADLVPHPGPAASMPAVQNGSGKTHEIISESESMTGMQESLQASGASETADRTQDYRHSDGTEGQQEALQELVRSTVLAGIKQQGRRLSFSEAEELFPKADSDIRAALQVLVTKGLIARDSQRTQSDRRTYAAGTNSGPEYAESISSTAFRGAGEVIGKIGDALRDAGIIGGSRGKLQTDQEYIEEYRRKVEQDASRERGGLRAHIGSFIGVNAFLIMLNLSTSPGFPWALFPLFGWGIGMVNHINEVKRKQDQVRHLEALPNINRQGLKLLQEYEKIRSGFSSHVVSTLATSALLLMINLVTSSAFMWSFIPIGVMGIGLIGHVGAFPGKMSKIRKRMERMGLLVPDLPLFRPSRRLPDPGEGGYSRTQQARIIRAVIQGQYKKAKRSGAPIDRDFLDLLDRYVDQIAALDAKSLDVLQLIQGIPVSDLERDLAVLKKRKDNTNSEQLQSEYSESIRQLEKQKASYRQLTNQQEMLDLRLTSSLNALKQLQIDMVRVQSMSNAQDSSLLQDLRGRSDDLNLYLSDVERSFAELES